MGLRGWGYGGCAGDPAARGNRKISRGVGVLSALEIVCYNKFCFDVFCLTVVSQLFRLTLSNVKGNC